jgi:phosphohistidine phosphatase
MRLTLLRHGVAVDHEKWQGADAERTLTEDGIVETTRLLKAVRGRIKAVEIWTSPWLRARQTAELASGIWKLPLREIDWLAGAALPAAERAARLQAHTDVVLVGHEPDLGELVRFLCGARIALKKAGLAVLKGEPRQGEMTLHCLLNPKLALELAGRD